MDRERGSALVTVILVVLVLTMVGLAAMLFMTVEDTISANDRYQKEAMYLAEVGLRAGEASLSAAGLTQGTTLLQRVDTHNQIPPTLAQCTGVQYLGTVLVDTLGQPLYNKAITYTGPGGAADRVGYFSVYVRNNKQDFTGSPTIDVDSVIDILAVGMVSSLGGNQSYQKILSEEFNMGGVGGGNYGGEWLQKGGVPGSVNQVNG